MRFKSLFVSPTVHERLVPALYCFTATSNLISGAPSLSVVMDLVSAHVIVPLRLS
jgi:hypothetical protein